MKNVCSKQIAKCWIQTAEEQIAIHQQKIDAGKASQANWVGWSGWQMNLGRVRFLHGEPIADVRKTFQKVAQGIVMSFSMAYDSSSRHFLVDKMDKSCVSYTIAVDGFNAGFMAEYLHAAVHLAQLVPTVPETNMVSKQVASYVLGLKYFLLNDPEKARSMLSGGMGHFNEQSFNNVGKSRFSASTYTLSGILEKNGTKFNEGLFMQSQLYQRRAIEYADTSEAYISDNMVALGKLGAYKKLNVVIDSPFLPKELI